MTTSGTPDRLHFTGLGTVLLFLLCTLVASANPEHFDIPAQSAPSALKLFNKQSSKPAVFITQDLQDIQANEVKGEFECDVALARLLANTGYEITKSTKVNFVIGRSGAQTTGSVKGSLTGEGG